MSSFAQFMAVFAHPMAFVGVGGQLLFSSRFIIQWIASERRGESTVPESFWYCSLIGGLLTAVYAAWRHDPIFLLAQCSGLIVYARNIMLIRARRRSAVR